MTKKFENTGLYQFLSDQGVTFDETGNPQEPEAENVPQKKKHKHAPAPLPVTRKKRELKNKHVQLLLRPSFYNEIVILADDLDISFNALATEALAEYLDRHRGEVAQYEIGTYQDEV